MSDTFRIEYKTLTDDERDQIRTVKDAAQKFLDVALDATQRHSGGSRYLTIMQDRLEETVMWAVKHITETH